MTAPDQVVPLETLRSWAEASDPLLNHLAFHTAYEHPESVPDLPEDERKRIALRFLEDALAGRLEGLPEGRYVYAHTALAWLRALVVDGDPESGRTLEALVDMLARVAREGDAETRDVVLLGALEHAFDDPATRAPFDSWVRDPQLAPLHEEALRLSA
jgi:hypothetical protein